MTGQEQRTAVLERDPELAGSLEGAELSAARRAATAAVLRVPRGPWLSAPTADELDGTLGLLVLDGVLARRIVADGAKASAELLGPGDVIQPWREVTADSSIDVAVAWEVIEPVELAVLDRGFAARVAPWPQVTTEVAGRIMGRAHWLGFHLAVCQIRRVDLRLMLVLWRLADRWGRVTPRGVELSIALPHSLLAALVVTRRPAVSLAMQGLETAGAVERRSRSHWTLHGEPPSLLAGGAWSPPRPAEDVLGSVPADIVAAAAAPSERWMTAPDTDPDGPLLRPDALAVSV